MKRKLLFLILMLALSISFVNAKEGPFFFDWEKQIDFGNPYVGEYNRGYIISEFTRNNKLDATIFDNDGNVLLNKEINPYNIDSVAYDENYYYILECYNDDLGYHSKITKLNNKMEVVKTLDLGNFQSYYYLNSSSQPSITVKNGVLYIANFEQSKLYKANASFDSIEEVPVDSQNFERTAIEYFPEIYSDTMIHNKDYTTTTSGDIYLSRTNNNKTIVGFQKYDSDCKKNLRSPTPTNMAIKVCPPVTVRLYDLSQNVLWEKEISDAWLNSVEIVNDYALVAIDTKVSSSIIIYDLSGNEIQTITDFEKEFKYLSRGYNGFITNLDCNYAPSTTPNVMPVPISPDSCRGSSQVYTLANLINTKVEGKGKIKVKDHSKPGIPVTFVVEPEEGYVLSKVDVTDSQGKTVTFTDYTFTMPTADVEVKAVFVANKNPNTNSGFLLSLIFLVFCSAFAVIVINYNKVHE